MKEIKLQYLGKRAPFQIRNCEISVDITSESQWFSEANANWLCNLNPRMFAKLDEKTMADESFVPAKEEVVKAPEKPQAVYADGDFKCDKCGNGFKVKWAYERHIKRCTGPEVIAEKPGREE